jgi:ATP diphosphatase
MTELSEKLYSIEDLMEIVRQLRDPEHGCPWDKVQTHETLIRHLLEEGAESYQSTMDRDWNGLKEELGDVLFQVVFHARIAEERGDFEFQEIVDLLCKKMIKRHPHVFTDKKTLSISHHGDSWETQKEKERSLKFQENSVMIDIPMALPALQRAQKISKRAARVGFEFQTTVEMLNKVREEVVELEEEIANNNTERIKEEFGDLLFALVSWARKVGVSAEVALSEANEKYVGRFSQMERVFLENGKTLKECELPEMLEAWEKIKKSG